MHQVKLKTDHEDLLKQLKEKEQSHNQQIREHIKDKENAVAMVKKEMAAKFDIY